MVRRQVSLVLALGLISACATSMDSAKKQGGRNMQNPFLGKWGTPFETPDFEKIKMWHYQPAMEAGMQRHNEEIKTIIDDSAAPSFDNTVMALDRAGSLLMKVQMVFANLLSAKTSEEMQSLAKVINPMVTAHWDEIYLNEKLFGRFKTLWDKKESLGLDEAQMSLLKKGFRYFVRGGALLDGKDKERFKEINQRLSLLSLNFGDNVLKETNRFEMLLDNEADLAGLPDAVKHKAAETAAGKGHEGKWMFSIHKPSLIPFLTYADNRALREKLFKAYIMQGDHGDELDNKAILREMVELRIERAKLLGYKSHAHYILEENMAKDPDAVLELLTKLWEAALPVAAREAKELQKMVRAEGRDFALQPWDWWYYAEKKRKADFDLDDDELRPYFKRENVRDGAFAVANRLFGITAEPRTDIPVYHPDVEVYEIKDSRGAHVGILYMDWFPRESKRGGAWMSNYREQYSAASGPVTPIITNVLNFTEPSGERPSLLSLDEVETLFHEFGHALHGLLSHVPYRSIAGTEVARDFVELPSQIMENWATEPEVLKLYAKHYETGAVISDALIAKIEKSRHFNQGFVTVELASAAFLDMAWHSLEKMTDMDVPTFEKKALNDIGLIPEIIVRYRSSYFRHVFAGGYSSGYYSYIWSQMLDADAFAVFQDKGLFHKQTAQSFKENILSKGSSAEPMVLYERFKGGQPDIQALLRRKGMAQ